jgi:chromosome segregation ATPase
LRIDSCLKEDKRALAASRDNLDRLYRDASNSLTILERSHRFTMTDLDHHRRELQVSQDEILRLRQLVSSKDSIIKDLSASKKLVAQELEAARLASKVVEDNCATLKAQCDKAMDKAIRAGRILMRRLGVVFLMTLLLTSRLRPMPRVALLLRSPLQKTLPIRDVLS